MNALKTAFLKNANYNLDQLLLIDKIISFLTELQKKGCQTKNVLHNLICDFIVMYTPLPTKQHQQFIVFDKKIGSGSYGNIYDSGDFEMMPIVTKSSTKFREDTIKEIFVNVVIINSLLLTTHSNHLIPTFGIFICSHRYSRKKLVSICETKNEFPNIHLVQLKITGKTLYKVLKKNISLSWFKKMLSQILSILIDLEKSKYNLYHRDLHTGNIMIDDATMSPYVIDFGLASFEIKVNDKQIEYCYTDEILYNGRRIKSAAYDVVALLCSCYQDTENQEIKIYCKKILHSLCGSLWSAENKTVDLLELETYHLYSQLYRAENLLSLDEMERVHQHNMDIINSITYSSFKDFV